MAGEHGCQHARTAADIQHFAFGMRREGGKQQLAARIQGVTAEHARQGFNGQTVKLIRIPECRGIKCCLFFQTAMVQTTAAGTVDFIQRGILFQHLLCASHAAAVLTDDENIAADRQQGEQVHQLELGFRFVLRPVVDQRIAVGDIALLCHQAKACALTHLAAQHLPVMVILGVGTAFSTVETRGQVILHISGKKNTAFFEIITVTQQDFTCRGKCRHELFLNKLRRGL